jgi:hypothetical protein
MASVAPTPTVSSRQKLQLLTVLTTPYKFELRRIEDILAIIRAEPTDDGQIAVLKNALAFYGLPDALDRLINHSKPSTSLQDYESAGEVIQKMVDGKELDCCAAFDGWNATVTAQTIFRQMNLAEKRVAKGNLGAVVWMEAVLRNPAHVPFTDISHVFPPYQRDEAIAAIIASPELYAEVTTLLRDGDLSKVSRWLVAVPCSNETREGLMLYAFSWITGVLKRQSAGVDITSLLAAIMGQGSPDPTAN